jgi:ATP/maltotriose-dependent transcriptional regulator MalT
MTVEEAQRLVVLSREARWRFPSSFGYPGPEATIELPDRNSFLEAVGVLADSGDGEAAVELAANVWRLWVLSGDLAGGRALLGVALDGAEPKQSRARALALYGDALLAHRQGALEDSRARNEEAMAAAQASGDEEALALAHLGLSRVALEDGDHQRAREHAVRAREFAQSASPRLGQAPLHLHAQSVRLAGEYEEAAALFAESLELNRRIGDQGMVVVELHNLGHVELRRGNVDDAERLFNELGAAEDPYGKAMTSLNQAAVAFARGDRDRAEDLLARTESMLEEAGVEPATDDRLEMDRLRDQLSAPETP